MMTLKEFGQTPASVPDSAPTIVAAWLTDFGDFGANVEIDLSVVAKADTFTIVQPVIGLYVGPSPTSLVGATLLMTLTISPTTGNYVGSKVSAALANPGGRQYVLVAGTQGSG